MLKVLPVKKELDAKGIFLYYSGRISQERLIQLGDIIRQKMTLEDVKSNTILKVFSMFVEQAQNIIRYSAEEAQSPAEAVDSQEGVLIVGHDGSYYFICGGNAVNTTDVPKLREKLDKIASMDKEQLKSYYREVRRGEAPEESKGAGLGFIEMARKVSEPFEFEFAELNDRESFFSLITKIKGE